MQPLGTQPHSRRAATPRGQPPVVSQVGGPPPKEHGAPLILFDTSGGSVCDATLLKRRCLEVSVSVTTEPTASPVVYSLIGLVAVVVTVRAATTTIAANV